MLKLPMYQTVCVEPLPVKDTGSVSAHMQYRTAAMASVWRQQSAVP